MERDRGRWPSILKTVSGQLDYLEERGLVDANPYWMGEAVGVIDVVYWPWFGHFDLHSHYRGLELPEKCVCLGRWFEVMRASESGGCILVAGVIHQGVCRIGLGGARFRLRSKK